MAHYASNRIFKKSRHLLPINTTIPKNEPRICYLSRQQMSLVVLVVQNTLLVLMMRYSRTQKAADQPLYLASTAVVMAEMVKIAACFIILRWQHSSWQDFGQQIKMDVIGKPRGLLIMMIPSGLYALQNNLLYIALSNLEAATFQITYQLKILSTAIFSVLLLGRSLNRTQWFALTMLMAGVTLVQTQQVMTAAVPDEPNSKDTHFQNPWIGLLAVLTSCVSSGFAGCYFEKILKTSTTSMWIRNIQLSLCGAFFSLLGMMIYDLPLIRAGGLFQGYDCMTWLVIINQALGGLLVAIVVKYADNILKGFATSISIIVSSIISFYLFAFQPTLGFIAGAIIVLIAMIIYSKESMPKSTSITKLYS
ncbi:nucleotide-sugar transporter-domain-containing protein [Radiomyces spectabilis]|uniref:nucleotide-sugar transporter-domain-containing protein n=1 Tax=Radiomyces spectabilis TaxID=64574 RepID=UPI00222064AB|nr:nucleotide-sugar transporter-domain-containing protein [Radiomyces spectabilis]KAI8377516.1 nucleotide-sugar transporter-domain-containing protein [Radiomyces spectabilis]